MQGFLPWVAISPIQESAGLRMPLIETMSDLFIRSAQRRGRFGQGAR
jgi:hypothetical protein